MRVSSSVRYRTDVRCRSRYRDKSCQRGNETYDMNGVSRLGAVLMSASTVLVAINARLLRLHTELRPATQR